MQIAAYPPSEQWLTIPEFPPPGWERERARRQSLRLGLHTPDRRAELERLLREVQRMDRPSALARLLYLGDDAQSLFAVDIVLVIAHDDGTKAARHWAQQQLLRRILGPVQPVRLRPSPDIAGFWGRADGEAVGTISHPGVVVVLRKAGLPTVAVDIVMKVWAARPAEVVPRIDEIAALARGVAPAVRAVRVRGPGPASETRRGGRCNDSPWTHRPWRASSRSWRPT